MSHPPKNPVALCVVIVNFRTADLVIDCLATLPDDIAAIPGAIVVVVDNGSGDDSLEQIETAIADNGWSFAQAIRSEQNLGFAGGNNVALEAFDADRYLLLNSDTLVRPGAIVELMTAMDDRPDIGLVGPRLEWPDGTPQESCFRFRTPITEMITAARTGPLTKLFASHEGTLPVSDDPIEPDWTTFACCLIRGDVIHQVGVLDAGYFMYFDDIDYCRRARNAGWGILHWPAAHVVHLRGKSGPVKEMLAKRGRRPAYFYESRNRYFGKFYGRLGLWLTNLLWEAGRLVAWCRELVGNKPPHTCEREARDIWTNAVNPLRAPHLSQSST